MTLDTPKISCQIPTFFQAQDMTQMGKQICHRPSIFQDVNTACGHRMAHRKWKETKLQPGTAGTGNMLGCCLVSLHFLRYILYPQAVQASYSIGIPLVGGHQMIVCIYDP